mgnify:CR=1 FL=1
MAYMKDEAIVVRRLAYSNTSLILSFITPERGLVEAIAKGARRENSPLHGTLDYFAAGELVAAGSRHGGLEVVASFALEDAHERLRSNLDAYAAAAFLCEASMAGCQPHDPAPGLYFLLRELLARLNAGQAPLPLALAGGLGVLTALGFQPQLDICANCGLDAEVGEAWLSGERGGLLCPACRREDARSWPVRGDALEALRHLSQAPLARADRLGLSSHARQEAARFVAGMAESFLGFRVRSSRAFLKRFSGSEKANAA